MSLTRTSTKSSAVFLPLTQSNLQLRITTGVLVKKSERLTKFDNEKHFLSSDQRKLIRDVFTNLSSSKMMPVEHLAEGFLALGFDTRADFRYEQFLSEFELNETTNGLLDFEHFLLLFFKYEEKLRIENEALRQLDLKIAFEFFDRKKDGMIDADELIETMNQLAVPIIEREAKEMIDFADQDKDSFLSFEEFLTVLAQISAISTSQVQR